MKKLVIAAMFLIGTAFAQSYPSVIQLMPASTTYPCPTGVAAKNGTVAICQTIPGIITVDFGDGKGYVQLTGAPGPAGPKGDPGSPGAAGTAATVAVGTTTTGTAATVTNSGTPSAAVLNFVLPVVTIQPTITCTAASFTIGGGAVLSGCH